MSLPGRCSLVVFLVAGCSSAPPADHGVVTLASPPAESRSTTVSLAACAVPKHFVLDGKLDEWGDLRPTTDPEHVSPAQRYPLMSAIGQGWPMREAKNAPNPTDADVRVGIAIDPGGVHLAVDFGNRAPSTLTLGLASIDWTVLSRTSDEDDGAIALDDDFMRHLRVSSAGAELVTEKGARAVEGAKVASADGGRSLEVFLPNTAMPRLVEAPLEYLRMAATLDAALPRKVFDEPWRWVKLPVPVRYEPFGELRDKVLTAVLEMGPVGGSSNSYLAADPLRVSSSTPDRGLSPLQPFGVLFEKKAALGDVEVGLGYAHIPFVVAMKAGKLTDVTLLTRQEEEFLAPKTEDLGDGRVQAIVTRNDEVHVIASTPSSLHTWSTGAHMLEHWTVVAVNREGKAIRWYCEVDDTVSSLSHIVGEPVLTFEPAFRSFGWKNAMAGTFFDDGKARLRELECAWDDAAKRYTARTRFTPPLPPSKRAR